MAYEALPPDQERVREFKPDPTQRELTDYRT
jgi:hypothetical protein